MSAPLPASPPAPDRPSPLVGSLTVIVAACLFSTLGVLSRITFELGLTPYAFVTWRSGVAALTMILADALIIQRSGNPAVPSTAAA